MESVEIEATALDDYAMVNSMALCIMTIKKGQSPSAIDFVSTLS